ncbi:MAG TPA: hypothetical protein PKW80_03760 [Bacteroidales bacterium]|nr:hypothetical protein [Bacteroidales bacterium]
MKKLIHFIVLFSIGYFVAAQSNIQKSVSNTYSSHTSCPAGDAQKTSITMGHAPATYQQVSAPTNNAPASSVPASNQYENHNQYETYNQYVAPTSRGYKKGYYSKPEQGQLLHIPDYYIPVIRKSVLPVNRPDKCIVVRKPDVLLSQSFDSVSPAVIKPVMQPEISTGHSRYGSTTNLKPKSKSSTPELPGYRCVYGDFTECNGLNWYSIHVASFKNPDFCRTAIRYFKGRYKLEVFVFYDFSVNMRYHLVIGKYRKHFAAENILRKMIKEMPGAFIVNWNRFSKMIIF